MFVEVKEKEKVNATLDEKETGRPFGQPWSWKGK